MGTTSNIKKPNHFGLIGKTLSHSFSRSYFLDKFKDLELEGYSYKNFEFETEADLAHFLLDEAFCLQGFNVTIPYKEIIIPYLDELHVTANSIQAVNTVLVKKNKLIGYNTDVYGFMESIKPMLATQHKQALILGTGGASKAVTHVLENFGIKVKFVSRNPKDSMMLNYQNLDEKLIKSHEVIINCTPLGTSPEINEYPDIPYHFLTKSHLVFDLIYNPKETLFLEKAKKQGASIQNGLKMLELQAEKSWEIWNL
jgi:shikimate dehydrogenase